MTDNSIPTASAVVPPCPMEKACGSSRGDMGRELVAAMWSPSASFATGNGELLPMYVWSALDCPGGRARRQFISSEPAVTAYLTVQQKAPNLREGPTSSPAGRYDRMVGNHFSAWRSLTETVSCVPLARRCGSPSPPERQVSGSMHRHQPSELGHTQRVKDYRTFRYPCRRIAKRLASGFPWLTNDGGAWDVLRRSRA